MLCWQRRNMVFLLVHVFETYRLKPRLIFFSVLSSVPSFLNNLEPIENLGKIGSYEKGV